VIPSLRTNENLFLLRSVLRMLQEDRTIRNSFDFSNIIRQGKEKRFVALDQIDLDDQSGTNRQQNLFSLNYRHLFGRRSTKIVGSFILLMILMAILAAFISIMVITEENSKSHIITPFSPDTANGSSYAPPLKAKNGAVAADAPECSEVGVEVLKEGGNAVDAAVATCLCQGVVNSFASGIGGGAVILIRLANGSMILIDSREIAPLKASRDMFLNDSKASTSGWCSRKFLILSELHFTAITMTMTMAMATTVFLYCSRCIVDCCSRRAKRTGSCMDSISQWKYILGSFVCSRYSIGSKWLSCQRLSSTANQ